MLPCGPFSHSCTVFTVLFVITIQEKKAAIKAAKKAKAAKKKEGKEKVRSFGIIMIDHQR